MTETQAGGERGALLQKGSSHARQALLPFPGMLILPSSRRSASCPTILTLQLQTAGTAGGQRAAQLGLLQLAIVSGLVWFVIVL